MSTLIEIQDAVALLPSNEKKALQLWLNSQAEPELTAQYIMDKLVVPVEE